ncbi:MAG: YgaP family membrane protein [Bacteroidota bacterium]
MKKNVGKTDKIIRIALGLVIAAAGIYFKSWWGLVAIIPLGTALISFCPLYGIFGLSTCPASKK